MFDFIIRAGTFIQKFQFCHIKERNIKEIFLEISCTDPTETTDLALTPLTEMKSELTDTLRRISSTDGHLHRFYLSIFLMFTVLILDKED